MTTERPNNHCPEPSDYPKDHAGYQQVFDCIVLTDDIIIPKGYSFEMGSWAWQTHSHGHGVQHDGTAYFSGNIAYPARVYRKMACPTNHDDKPIPFRDVQPPPQEYAYIKDNDKGFLDDLKKAKTYDDGKPPLANLPWEGIKAVSRVQAYGHRKYKDYNNFRKGMEVSRNLSCAVRHIAAYMEGETLDPESKESHLAHAACRLLFVLQNEHDGVAIDDRFKK